MLRPATIDTTDTKDAPRRATDHRASPPTDTATEPEKDGGQDGGQPGVTARIGQALQAGRIDTARTILAEGEQDGTLSVSDIAAAKARIARADGDLAAARAILIMAIERYPAATALRALLSEILLAVGTAGSARDVQAHLGRAPQDGVLAASQGDDTGT